jgi:hypothetical protein
MQLTRGDLRDHDGVIDCPDESPFAVGTECITENSADAAELYHLFGSLAVPHALSDKWVRWTAGLKKLRVCLLSVPLMPIDIEELCDGALKRRGVEP